MSISDTLAPAETRKLAAIMFTDIAGFSRQMGADEPRMLRLLELHNQIIQQAVADHHGHVIKTMGDAFLVEFPSVVHAVQCAQQIQAQLRAHNAEQESAEQVHVRIGIHLGDIVQRDGDVFGDGVNIASRLQALAEPDTICISQVVYKEVEKKLALGTVVSLGKPKLKNIAERFHVYALLPAPPTGLWQRLQVQRLKLSRRVRPAHRITAGVVLALIAGGLLTTQTPFFSSIRNPHSPLRNQEFLPLPDKPSIVILPFVNMSEDPQQEYFSDGLTEDLTSSLSRLSGLFVISRNTAFFYKGKAMKLPELSKELGVQYVLEGSVRKADGQVRVTTQLIDATQDRHLWSERYDRPLKDIFALQDEIVQKIVTTLKLQLSLWEQGILVRKTTDSLEAYDEYLRGRALLFHLKKEVTTEARRMFERAIELDSQYAEAYTALGFTYLTEWSYQWSQTPQTLEQAFEFAQKAVALDNSIPAAHLTLSWVYQWKKQYEQAIAEGERAIALDPNGADGYAILAEVLSYAVRPEEAIELIEKAMRLSPQYPAWYLITLGRAYLFAGRTEEAITTLKKALVRNRDLLPPHVLLVFLYSESGRDEEARAEVTEVLRVSPNFSLESLQQRAPYKDPAVLERYLAALRKAGLK